MHFTAKNIFTLFYLIFSKWLNINGFLLEICKNPGQLTPCVIDSSKRLTFDELRHFIEPNVSPKGTNKYQLDLVVYKYFTDALKELDQLRKIFFGTTFSYAVGFDV